MHIYKKGLSNKRPVLEGEVSEQTSPVLLILRDKGHLKAAHLMRCLDVRSQSQVIDRGNLYAVNSGFLICARYCAGLWGPREEGRRLLRERQWVVAEAFE